MKREDKGVIYAVATLVGAVILAVGAVGVTFTEDIAISERFWLVSVLGWAIICIAQVARTAGKRRKQ